MFEPICNGPLEREQFCDIFRVAHTLNDGLSILQPFCSSALFSCDSVTSPIIGEVIIGKLLSLLLIFDGF